MNVFDILEIVIVALCAITYGFMLYFKVKGNVLGAVSELIALAEETGLAGSEKMAKVVDELYEKVPGPLKRVLNKECLEKRLFRLRAKRRPRPRWWRRQPISSRSCSS